MSDDKQKDHWQALAADLGATPAPESPPPPLVEKPAEPGGRVPPAARRPAPKRSASGWNELAKELGISVPAEPAEVAPAPVPAPRSARQASPCEPAEARRPIVPEARSVEAPEAAEADKPAKKRRRRRRPRGQGEPAVSGAEVALPEAVGPEEAASDEILPLPQGDELVLFETESPKVEGEPGAEPSPERGKRRRRRPRRKKSAATAATSETAAPAEESKTPAPEAPAPKRSRRAKSAEIDDVEEDATADADVDEDADEAPSPTTKKLSPTHRGIPSWEEAGGLVIAVNMESRAKRPGGSSPRPSRGGRPRGGRDKSGPKNAKPS